MEDKIPSKQVNSAINNCKEKWQLKHHRKNLDKPSGLHIIVNLQPHSLKIMSHGKNFYYPSTVC